jgi:hypothetical protein
MVTSSSNGCNVADPSPMMQGKVRAAPTCPLRVNRVTLAVRRLLPVNPDERTYSDQPSTSQTCQVRNTRPLSKYLPDCP